MAKAFGEDLSIAQARQAGLNGGNYTSNGMLGPSSEVRMLKDLGIPAHIDSPLNWDNIKAQLSAGKPVIVSTANHYFVIESYDAASGKFDCGNSALAMKASGGRTLMSPQDFTNWGGGSVTAIVAD